MPKIAAIYDIAISFAGEDRTLASQIASGLVLKGLNVFYDEYVKSELWGKDLYAHLIEIYRDQSKFCLMLISSDYVLKQWTSHERRAAQARAFTENREYILPLRLDDSHIDGVLGTTGYIDFRHSSVEEVVELLQEKVKSFNQENGIEYTIVRVEDVFREAGINGPCQYEFRDSDFDTMCPTCGSEQHLAQAPITLDGDDTLYSCINGCQTIAVISRPGLVPWPGRGCRLGTHVIRNASDIKVQVEGMRAPILISASRAALMKVRVVS